MPDIISRIKVEAQGADQAAREIEKLAAAYEKVRVAARDLSPGKLGADPFTQATAGPGGVPGIGGPPGPGGPGGYNPPAPPPRHDHTNGGRSGGSEASRFINQGFNAADNLSAGRGMGAVGGIASSLATVLTNPLAIGGALAFGALGMGVQKLASTEEGRVRDIYGSGMSQRLGKNYEHVRNAQIAYARTGVPEGMVAEYFNAASQSGLRMDRHGLASSSMMLEAATTLGLGPADAAQLLGAASKNKLDMGRFSGDRGGGLVGMASYTLGGRENLGAYFREITAAITTMSEKGITINEESLTKQIDLIGALGKLGGLSGDGAVAASRTLRDRGISAASLQRPEDLVAYAAVRAAPETKDLGHVGTMKYMEENPTEVNRLVYEHIQKTSGSPDEASLRWQSYTGMGIGMALKSEKTVAGLAAGTPYRKEYDSEWIRLHGDPIGRGSTAMSQGHLFEGFEKDALKLSQKLAGFLQGTPYMSALGVGWDTNPVPISKDATKVIDNSTRIGSNLPGNIMDLYRDAKKRNDSYSWTAAGMTGVESAFQSSLNTAVQHLNKTRRPANDRTEMEEQMRTIRNTFEANPMGTEASFLKNMEDMISALTILLVNSGAIQGLATDTRRTGSIDQGRIP